MYGHISVGENFLEHLTTKSILVWRRKNCNLVCGEFFGISKHLVDSLELSQDSWHKFVYILLDK